MTGVTRASPIGLDFSPQSQCSVQDLYSFVCLHALTLVCADVYCACRSTSVEVTLHGFQGLNLRIPVLGGKHLYPLSHLDIPMLYKRKKIKCLHSVSKDLHTSPSAETAVTPI